MVPSSSEKLPHWQPTLFLPQPNPSPAADLSEEEQILSCHIQNTLDIYPFWIPLRISVRGKDLEMILTSPVH